jgi:hypothetical protein
MRIGIDARELCGRPTGVGRYLSGLLADQAEQARLRAAGLERARSFSWDRTARAVDALLDRTAAG